MISANTLKAAVVAANTVPAEVRATLAPVMLLRSHWCVISTDADQIVRKMGNILADIFEKPIFGDVFTAVLPCPHGPLLITVMPKSAVTPARLAEALIAHDPLRMEENLVSVEVVVVEKDDCRAAMVRDWFYSFLRGSNAG